MEPGRQHLAFLQGDELKFNAYITDVLAVADATQRQGARAHRGLDRAVLGTAVLRRRRARSCSRSRTTATSTRPRSSSPRRRDRRLARDVVVHELAAAPGHTAVLVSSDKAPAEVYALEQGKLRPLSAHNQALFAELTLGAVRTSRFTRRGGTEVHGQIVKPPGYVPGRRYPTILWIHGGPNGQDDHSLELWGYGPPLERQLFATHGYVVLGDQLSRRHRPRRRRTRAPSARTGATRRSRTCWPGVDYAVAQGIADPQRLGIGGWSYGGILTDYTIASDARFKAAISGAGSGNQTGMYGADEYVVQYNAELGPPWRDTALWLKVSYPFFHADRIRTPTLFLGGDKDFNVPIAGGEQMYQALRTLGVPAQLIVYPGEFHVLTRPSFLVDRSQRYLEWMDRYLKARTSLRALGRREQATSARCGTPRPWRGARRGR